MRVGPASKAFSIEDATAELRAENWDLPASQLKLEQQFSRVRSNVHAAWAANRFTADVRAEATPLAAAVTDDAALMLRYRDGDTRGPWEAWTQLAALTPGDLDVFFLTNGGAEANENALHLARKHTGRQRIVTHASAP